MCIKSGAQQKSFWIYVILLIYLKHIKFQICRYYIHIYCYMYVYMFCKNELQAKLFVLFTLYLSNNTIVVSVKVLETNLLCAPVHGVETINVVWYSPSPLLLTPTMLLYTRSSIVVSRTKENCPKQYIDISRNMSIIFRNTYTNDSTWLTLG